MQLLNNPTNGVMYAQIDRKADNGIPLKLNEKMSVPESLHKRDETKK